MNILKEIKIDILEGNKNISDILRKFKVLVYKIKNKDLIEWVDNELNGYKTEDKIPEYRVFRNINYIGVFCGVNYQEVKHIIPNNRIPKELLNKVKIFYKKEKISEIELLVKDNISNNLWPGDWIDYFNEKVTMFHDGKNKFNLMFVYFDSKKLMCNIIDEIKNRLLDAILKIEVEIGYLPETENILINKEGVIINNIFNSCVFEDSNILINSKNSKKEIKK